MGPYFSLIDDDVIDINKRKEDILDSNLYYRQLKGLKGSIKKWERIVVGTAENGGSTDCPLCHEFNVGGRGDCVGCPVFIVSGRTGCHGTPYDDCLLATQHKNKDEFLDSAVKFLNYLKDLYIKWLEKGAVEKSTVEKKEEWIDVTKDCRFLPYVPEGGGGYCSLEARYKGEPVAFLHFRDHGTLDAYPNSPHGIGYEIRINKEAHGLCIEKRVLK